MNDGVGLVRISKLECSIIKFRPEKILNIKSLRGKSEKKIPLINAKRKLNFKDKYLL